MSRIVNYSNRSRLRYVDLLNDGLDENTEVIDDSNDPEVAEDGSVDVTDSVDMQNDLRYMLESEAEVEELNDVADANMGNADMVQESIDTADDLETSIVEGGDDAPTETETDMTLAQESMKLAMLTGETSFSRALEYKAESMDRIQNLRSYRNVRFKSNASRLGDASRAMESLGLESISSYRRRSHKTSLEKVQIFKESAKEYFYAFLDTIIAAIRKIIIAIKRGYQKVLSYFSKFEKEATSMEKKLKDVASTAEATDFITKANAANHTAAGLSPEKFKAIQDKFEKMKDDWKDNAIKIFEPVSALMVINQTDGFKNNIVDMTVDKVRETVNGVKKQLGANATLKGIEKMQSKFKDKIDGSLEKLSNDLYDALKTGYLIENKISVKCKGKEVMEVDLEAGEVCYITYIANNTIKGIIMNCNDADNASASNKKRFTGTTNYNSSIDTSYMEALQNEDFTKFMDSVIKIRDEMRGITSLLKKCQSKIDENTKKSYDVLEGAIGMIDRMKSKNRTEEGDFDKEQQTFLKVLAAVYKKAASDSVYSYINAHKGAAAFVANSIKYLPSKSDVKIN